MDKAYNPDTELQTYQLWEQSQAFTPTVPADPKPAKKSRPPFTVILPPPNANDPLHAGHALYTVEDIMVRYHRMLGDPTLWLPGTDHAGIETQFVFEKKLQKEGKSRFDFDRNTLFSKIAAYVDDNRTIAVDQMKRLGFSLDWSRLKFAMDPDHNDRIYAIFRKMIRGGLIYRDEKIVNYCTFCGTSFSNLEVVHKSVASHLWYINYGPLTVATTRPETMLGDTAVAVNPSDPRYQKLIGTTIKLPIVDREIPVIGDDSVDPEFGTGAVKVTPSHSPEDYDLAKKHNLEFIRIFDYDGKANHHVPAQYRGLFPNQVRQALVAELETQGFLTKTEDYTHEVGHCYRCGRPIEPITAPQWFVKIQPLADQAVAAVKADKVKFFPPRFKKQFLLWMKDIRDWNISRQVVWGQRIPIWYNLDQNPDILINYLDSDNKIISGSWAKLKDTANFDQIKTGLQTLLAPADAKYYLSEIDAQTQSKHVLQETDTFDTWFSSGQWPYSTLGFNPDHPDQSSPDFKYFYPTTVLDTMWDILFFWVARMIMFGLYATGEVPFRVAHMHSRVVDAKGQKMSKSKGNVINPVDIAAKYGADALRMALVIGVAPGSDIPLSDDKVRAQRNFVNKIWNASRFVLLMADRLKQETSDLDLVTLNPAAFTPEDKDILSSLDQITASTTKHLDNYRFGQASEDLYHFFWHQFCDQYIESAKNRGADSMPVLIKVLTDSLKLLHPFVPFVTESVYQNLQKQFNLKESQLITAAWPAANAKN